MRTLVAILAVSTGLLHAQAKSPAQPVSTPILLAASTPLTSAPDIPAHTRRISTGVTPAHLVHSVNLEEPRAFVLRHSSAPRTVALTMTVDAKGKPEDLRLVHSSDPLTTREVFNAVAKFRYVPATVSGVPVAQSVSLEVTVDSN